MAIHTDPPSHLLSLSEMSYLFIFSTALWFYFAAVFPVETKPAVPCAELFLLYHHFVTSVIPLPYEVLRLCFKQSQTNISPRVTCLRALMGILAFPHVLYSC